MIGKLVEIPFLTMQILLHNYQHTESSNVLKFLQNQRGNQPGF